MRNCANGATSRTSLSAMVGGGGSRLARGSRRCARLAVVGLRPRLAAELRLSAKLSVILRSPSSLSLL